MNFFLLFSCYQKLGDWRLQLEERSISGPTISSILQYYHKATEYDRTSYKAWHAWAFMNFQALLEHKKPSGEGCGWWVELWWVWEVGGVSLIGLNCFTGAGKPAAYASPGEIGRSTNSAREQKTTPTSSYHAPPTESKLITYACSAVHGFFRSISLSLQSSLQDTLRSEIIHHVLNHQHVFTWP